MKYEAWNSVRYSDTEPLVPFSKIYESENLNEVVDFIDENEESYGVIFVTGIGGEILFDTSTKIYESIDGNEVFERNRLSNKSKIKTK
jgi:hypothetical protein